MSHEPDYKNGWNEWSRHVLKELERLNYNYESLRDEVSKTHSELTEIKRLQNDIDKVIVWRNNMSEVMTPTQLGELKRDIESLKSFKTAATTIIVVSQLALGIAIAVIGIFV